MRNRPAQSTSRTQPFRYKKFYLTCGAIVLSISMALAGLSVRDMYTTNSAQELEFYQQQLQSQLQELEQKTSQTQSLLSINQKAASEGFVKVDQLTHTPADTAIQTSFLSSAR